MFYKALIALAFSALAVNAQTSTSVATASTAAASPSGPATPPTSSIPPCVLNCTSTAATQNGCAGVTDVACVCTNTRFQQAAGQCLQSCTPAEQQAAAALQSSVCASVSASSTPSGSKASTSPTAPASSKPASSSSAPAGSSSSAPAKSNAAAGLPAPFSFGIAHVVGLASVALAIVAGGATLF